MNTMDIFIKRFFSSINLCKQAFVILFLLSLSNLGYAQYIPIYGPISANQNDTDYYDIYDIEDDIEDYIWEVYDGQIISEDETSVTIKWIYGGSQDLYYEAETYYDYYWGDKTVNVASAGPSTPSAPQRITNGSCLGQATLKRVGTPPSGVTWYWQGKSSSGTSTTIGSGQYYYPTTASYGTGYYYIRARDNSTGQWSTSSGKSSYVTITNPPTQESAYIQGQGEYCGSGHQMGLALPYPPDILNNTVYKLYKNGVYKAQVTKVNDTNYSLDFGYIGQAGTYTATATYGGCTVTINHSTVVAGPVPAPSNPYIFVENSIQENGSEGTPSYCLGNIHFRGDVSGVKWYKDGVYTGVTSATYTPTATGEHTYKASKSISYCGSTSTYWSQNLTINVIPYVGQVSTPTGTSSRCQGGGTLDYNASASNASSYSWTVTSGAGTINSSGLVTWNSSFSGTATVTVTAHGCGSSTSASKSVIVTPSVSQVSTPTGTSSRCRGSGTSNYEASPSNESHFSWTVTSGAGTINSEGLVTWNSSFSGTATVTVTAHGCGSSTSASKSVTVTPYVGQVSTPTGTSSRCRGGGTSDYNASASNASSYSWTVTPSAGTINSSGLVTWNSSYSGTAIVIVTAHGCGSSTSANKSVTVTPYVGQVSTPTGTSSRCRGGGTLDYNASASNASSYSWTVTSGAGTINSSGLVTWNSSFSGTATVTVTAHGCGSSTSANKSVTVTPYVGQVSTPTGPSSICRGSSPSNYGASASNETSYSWTVTQEAGTINSEGLVTWNSSYSGTATVTVTAHGCGPSTSANKSVTVTPDVGQVSTPTGTSTRCQGSDTSNYSASASNYSSYSWTITPDAGTINSSGFVTWDSSYSGTAIVTVTANGCGSSTNASKSVTVTPIVGQVSTPTGTSTRCQGSGTSNYNASASNFSSYSWTITSGAGTINSDGLVTWNSSYSGTATVTVTAHGCGGSSTNASKSVIVNSLPSVSAGSDQQVFNASVLSLSGESPAGGTWSGSGVAGSTFTATTAGVGNHTITYSYTDGNGCSNNDTRTITVVSNPVIALSGPSTISAGETVSLSVPTGYTYQWLKDNQNIAGATTNEYVVSMSGNYEVDVTSSTGTGYRTAEVVINKQFGSQDQNYVVSWAFKEAGADPENISDDPESASLQIAYYDGLGRPSQQVSFQASPTKKDLVQHIDYDDYGRQRINFLPYSAHLTESDDATFKAGAKTEQEAFYDNHYTLGVGVFARAETIMESSPLNRVLKQGAPGATWQPDPDVSVTTDKVIRQSYGTNGIGEVKLWTINVSEEPESTVDYTENELYKSTTTDEQGNEVIAYTDKLGRVVLKSVEADLEGATVIWAHTYYVYDDFGNLRFVTPPEAVEALDRSEPVTTVMNDFGFQYKYDERQRMIAKKVPGAEWVYMVYDQWDRLVLTQDGNQRDPLKGNGVEWSFTKYDVLNRPIMTGVYLSSASSATHISNMETYLRYESTDASTTGYALSASYPVVVESDLQTITYYDDYTFPRTATLDFVPELDNTAYNTMVKGLVTGSKVRNLTTQEWLESAMYYDNKYRVIQSLAENQLGGVDRTSNRYDFIGKVLETKTSHDDKQIAKKFEYDHADRLLSSNQAIASSVEWTDLVGVDIDANGDLVKTSTDGYGNSGAASIHSIAAGQDGWVEVKVESNYRVLVGFSETNDNAHYNTIDYCIYLAPNRTLHAYQNGSNKGNLSSYVDGDIIRVARENGNINYYKNGDLLKTLTVGSTSTLLVDVALYYTGDKITSTSLTVGGAVQISQNNYNELGQLIEKNLHSTDQGTTFEQSVDYDYNIRGWLTAINNASLTSTGSNDDTDQMNDYWGMELGYDQSLSGITVTDLAFNGNISAVKWSDEAGLSATKERAYLYKYDPMNRILEADQKKKIGVWVDEDAYDLRGMQYDLNGNIEALTRKDKIGGDMDLLAYTYDGNKLLKVDDNGNDTEGFKDGINGGNDYAYDDNGNMTSDLNKDIAAIDYNYLNLPEKVTMADGKYITYQYDAVGIKLAQEVYDNVAVLQKRTDYVGEFIYETAGTAERKLQLIQHEEGRVVAKSEKIAMDIEWTFNSDTEGFTSAGGITGFQQALPGHLEGTVTTNDPIFRSPDNLNFEANKYDIVKIRLENNSPSVTAQLFFTTTTATSESESKSLRFTTTPNSGYTEYILDMSSVSTWSGAIKRLRFDPGNQLGDFKVDNIIVEGNSYIEEYEYQYHLKDHLGNTRLTFTTKDEVDEYLATMETSFAEIEQPHFANWEDTRLNNDVYDHTDAGTIFTYSAMLQGKTGPGMLLQVLPGDVVDMEVYAKYADDASTKGAKELGSALLAGLTNGFSTIGAGETTVLTDMFNAAQGASLLGDKDNGTDAPEAYLEYLFFDENNDPLTLGEGLTGYSPVTVAAKGAFEMLELAQLTVPAKARYMFIFVYNASLGKPVYFDDLKITHTKNKIVQMDDYYPFGLSFNSFQRQDKLENKFLYQGKEEQEEIGTYDFEWRMFDASLGRTWQIDPHSENYYEWSNYSWAGDNPIINIDPTGMDWYSSYDDDGNVTSTMWVEGSDEIEGYENIGAEYTMVIGDGASMTFTQNEATSMGFKTADNSSWETSQTSEYGNCYKASCAMLKNEGVETGGRANEILITKGTDKGRAGDASTDAQKGISVIDNTIQNGEPLVVGVDYRDGYPGSQADKRTDHFVVIRGMTLQLSNGQVTSKTYNYLDPGTSHSSKGTSSSRTLSVSGNRLTGTHMNNPKLTLVVTTVRKNK